MSWTRLTSGEDSASIFEEDGFDERDIDRVGTRRRMRHRRGRVGQVEDGDWRRACGGDVLAGEGREGES